MPKEITEQRNSMFREDLKSLAAYDAADVVWPLLQYARRQINIPQKQLLDDYRSWIGDFGFGWSLDEDDD